MSAKPSGQAAFFREAWHATRRGFLDRRLQLMLLAFMLFWYGTLLWLSVGPAQLKAPVNMTFNSMLAHLLKGQFDVDPRIVGDEGFIRNGRVYAYWGIWCALLRLPLWILHRMNVDMTAWSCLAAVCAAGMAKVRAVLLLQRHGAHDPVAKSAISLMLAYIVLGGSGTGYLKSSIYQEVIFWAAAFGAIFVYFAIKGLVNRQFDLGTLCWMALCAGLALLTRVSTGIGLILTFGLLLLILVVQSGIGAPDRRPVIQRWKQALLDRSILVPLAILAVCIAAAGAVNYFRWGSPMTFGDFRFYLENKNFPDRIARESMYGLFNFQRIPFGVLYYFFPVWALKTSGGGLLFEQAQLRWFDLIEPPPSSFLLTDLLPLCFIAFLIIALFRRRLRILLPVSQCAALAAGLLVPCILMLSYISMTYRYRMEFYPEIDFLAFLGLYSILTDQETRAKFGRCRIWMEAALIVSAVASFAALILYDVSLFGPAQAILRHG
jgi:hypothetical protein